MCPLHKARHYGHGPYTYIFILDERVLRTLAHWPAARRTADGLRKRFSVVV